MMGRERQADKGRPKTRDSNRPATHPGPTRARPPGGPKRDERPPGPGRKAESGATSANGTHPSERPDREFGQDALRDYKLTTGEERDIGICR